MTIKELENMFEKMLSDDNYFLRKSNIQKKYSGGGMNIMVTGGQYKAKLHKLDMQGTMKWFEIFLKSMDFDFAKKSFPKWKGHCFRSIFGSCELLKERKFTGNISLYCGEQENIFCFQNGDFYIDQIKPSENRKRILCNKAMLEVKLQFIYNLCEYYSEDNFSELLFNKLTEEALL